MRLIALLFILCSLNSAALCKADRIPCGLRLSFINVGEGDSIVVETANADPLVIDSGNPLGVFKTIAYLKSRVAKNLSGIIATHPHLDHASGVFSLINLFPRSKRFDNGQSINDAAQINDMYRWYEESFREATYYSILREGNSLHLGKAKLFVLWPPKGNLSSDWNFESLVLALSYGKFRALLMGDALEGTEQRLIEKNIDLRAHVLKVGHHGSKFASSAQFLTRVQAKLGVISVDANNIRGYPASNTVTRLEQVSKVMRTDINGTITVCAETDGSFNFKSESSRGD